MGDVPEEQKLLESIDKKIEWLKLMKKIIPPLYGEIRNQEDKQEKSKQRILVHISKKNNSGALAEAENYIKAERKLKAFKEINKQCQKIGKDVSFLTNAKGKLELDESGTAPAVANVVYASICCPRELCALKRELETASGKLKDWCDNAIYKQGTRAERPVKSSISDNLSERKEVTADEKQQKVNEIARARRQSTSSS